MKIQLSPRRIINGAVTVWHEHGPEVDIVMDLKRLTFAPGSLEALYSFHALDHLFEGEVHTALENWSRCLMPGAKRMYIVVNDFEFIARSFVGGDINIKIMNDQFSTPTYFSQDSLIKHLQAVGYPLDQIILWHTSPTDLFEKQLYELVINV